MSDVVAPPPPSPGLSARGEAPMEAHIKHSPQLGVSPERRVEEATARARASPASGARPLASRSPVTPGSGGERPAATTVVSPHAQVSPASVPRQLDFNRGALPPLNTKPSPMVFTLLSPHATGNLSPPRGPTLSSPARPAPVSGSFSAGTVPQVVLQDESGSEYSEEEMDTAPSRAPGTGPVHGLGPSARDRQLSFLEASLIGDPEATASASASSDDDCLPGMETMTTLQRHQWNKDRADVAWRWSWLNLQLHELETEASQINQQYLTTRSRKDPVRMATQYENTFHSARTTGTMRLARKRKLRKKPPSARNIKTVGQHPLFSLPDYEHRNRRGTRPVATTPRTTPAVRHVNRERERMRASKIPKNRRVPPPEPSGLEGVAGATVGGTPGRPRHRVGPGRRPTASPAAPRVAKVEGSIVRVRIPVRTSERERRPTRMDDDEDESGLFSPTSQASTPGARGGLKKRGARTKEYDLDNIVLPSPSPAQSFAIPILEYKEIVTPTFHVAPTPSFPPSVFDPTTGRKTPSNPLFSPPSTRRGLGGAPSPAMSARNPLHTPMSPPPAASRGFNGSALGVATGVDTAMPDALSSEEDITDETFYRRHAIYEYREQKRATAAINEKKRKAAEDAAARKDVVTTSTADTLMTDALNLSGEGGAGAPKTPGPTPHTPLSAETPRQKARPRPAIFSPAPAEQEAQKVQLPKRFWSKGRTYEEMCKAAAAAPAVQQKIRSYSRDSGSGSDEPAPVPMRQAMPHKRKRGTGRVGRPPKRPPPTTGPGSGVRVTISVPRREVLAAAAAAAGEAPPTPYPTAAPGPGRRRRGAAVHEFDGYFGLSKDQCASELGLWAAERVVAPPPPAAGGAAATAPGVAPAPGATTPAVNGRAPLRNVLVLRRVQPQ